jgi:hypothetical protein
MKAGRYIGLTVIVAPPAVQCIGRIDGTSVKHTGGHILDNSAIKVSRHIGLAVVVVSPTVQCNGFVDDASVVPIAAYGPHANAIKAVRHVGGPAVVRTVVVFPPAVQCMGCIDGASVEPTDRHGLDGNANEAGRHIGLAAVVVPPAVQQRADVTISLPRTDIDMHGAGGGSAISIAHGSKKHHNKTHCVRSKSVKHHDGFSAGQHKEKAQEKVEKSDYVARKFPATAIHGKVTHLCFRQTEYPLHMVVWWCGVEAPVVDCTMVTANRRGGLCYLLCDPLVRTNTAGSTLCNNWQ